MISPARRRIALAASAAGAAIVALDGGVLLVAQPSLQRDLDASVAEVQWTSTGYLVAVAALLVLAGRLGDRFGHRRLLCAGVLGFGAASAGIAVAGSVGWVIALRVAQGVFGALLQPATLALLRLAYPEDRLGRPIAVRTSALAVAAGAGPVLGGLVVAHLGWRAVFWINVPVALAIALLTLAVRVPAPERPADGGGRVGLAGAALLATALAALVHALAGIPERGWTGSGTLLGLLAAAGALALLVAYERRAEHPNVPRGVARSVPVTASVAILLVTTAGLFGTLFRATFHLQDALRLDPLATGLRVLPLTALMVLGAPVAGAALRRYGPRRTAVCGTLLVVLGIALLSRSGPDGAWAAMAAAFAVLGAGFATVMVTATASVVGDAPPGYAGVVGGLKQTAMNVGPTLGIAVAAGTTGATGAAGMQDAAMGTTLLLLAAVAALGLLPASLLPRPGRAPAR
ncbi:MFS transporter [Actinacidiphila glaucinigra]|uniref:MFS transporter n=1 Tax=Actinacidiphila glaucinigra TaxID=235986 RepID=UPI00386B9811